MAALHAVSLSDLTPQQRATLTEPREGLPPDTSKWPAYARHLWDIGLHDKALRARYEGDFWKWYKVDAGDTWRESVSNSMLRTAIYHARQLAREQESKYRHMEPYINKVFTFGRFRFFEPSMHLTRHLVRNLRKIITKRFPDVTFDKLGEDSRYGVLKFLCTAPIDGALASQIRDILPPGVFFESKVHYKDDFREMLRRLVAPDLPLSAEGRADFEMLLEGLQQVKLHGVSRSDRHKFVYDPAYTDLADYDGTPVTKRPHRSPKTGRPARFVSPTVGKEVTADQIHDDEWTPIGP